MVLQDKGLTVAEGLRKLRRALVVVGGLAGVLAWRKQNNLDNGVDSSHAHLLYHRADTVCRMLLDEAEKQVEEDAPADEEAPADETNPYVALAAVLYANGISKSYGMRLGKDNIVADVIGTINTFEQLHQAGAYHKMELVHQVGRSFPPLLSLDLFCRSSQRR